ncbi:MAG: hypothetical protein KDB02_05605, partial [Acidimicrobiales bacterium]|nr:hypothetical protein [Acidimicrobiales bacterium]
GALRIMPGWEIRAFGFEIPNPFFPGVLLAGVTFTLLYAWPFLEARVTGDHAIHHLDDRPRQRPVRTALGVATFTFYALCFLGGASDVVSTTFGLSVNAVLWTLRFAVFVIPPIVAFATYRLCKELSARDGLLTTSRVHWKEIPGRLLHGAPESSDIGDTDDTASAEGAS